MDQAPKDQPQVRRLGRPRKVEITKDAVVDIDTRAQDLANRIWAGQSPDAISRGERLARVKAALEAQGLSMEGVIL